MASSLVVEDPSISKISARPTGQISSCKGRGSHAISGLYYVVAASTGLFTTTTIIPWHQTVREKLYSSFLLFMAYMCTEYRLVLTDTTTQCHLSHIISSSTTCTIRIRSYI